MIHIYSKLKIIYIINPKKTKNYEQRICKESG